MMLVYTAECISFLLQICGQHVIIKHSYMAITIYYLPLMQLHHHCITTQEVSVAHNAESLANEIEEVLNK